MRAIDLLQRLCHNPNEAVIVYADPRLRAAEGRSWIIDRRGIVVHKANVDIQTTQLQDEKMLRCVACLWPSRAKIYRPGTDYSA